MIIKLPESFYYATNETNYAYVDNGMLYIFGHINFEALMYTITYSLYGYDKCRYCGRSLTTEKRTLDHIYPRKYGGVSISDNLLPCCVKCNDSKADMAPFQYREWKKMKTQDGKRAYYRACIIENSNRTLRGKFILPKRWLNDYDISKILYDHDVSCIEQCQLDKIDDFYKTNHRYSHPIIVSQNNWLLKGMPIVLHSKLNNGTTVTAIVLENVVVIRDAR